MKVLKYVKDFWGLFPGSMLPQVAFVGGGLSGGGTFVGGLLSGTRGMNISKY